MKQQYAVKISKQGQITLPAKLRETLKITEGSYVMLALSPDNKTITVNDQPAIAKHFGSLANAWTSNEMDAVEATRHVRDKMQAKEEK